MMHRITLLCRHLQALHNRLPAAQSLSGIILRHCRYTRPVLQMCKWHMRQRLLLKLVSLSAVIYVIRRILDTR
jgi:hypothetical protein